MILNCVPVAKMWDFSIKGGHCIDSVSFYYALAGTCLLGSNRVKLIRSRNKHRAGSNYYFATASGSLETPAKTQPKGTYTSTESISTIQILINIDRANLPLRPRLLRHNHSNNPHLQRRKSQNLHRQQESHPLVHGRSQPRRKTALSTPPQTGPMLIPSLDNRRLRPNVRPSIQILHLNIVFLPDPRRRSLLPSQQDTPQRQDEKYKKFTQRCIRWQ